MEFRRIYIHQARPQRLCIIPLKMTHEKCIISPSKTGDNEKWPTPTYTWCFHTILYQTFILMKEPIIFNI